MVLVSLNSLMGRENELEMFKATMAENLADSAEDVSLQGQETK